MFGFHVALATPICTGVDGMVCVTFPLTVIAADPLRPMFLTTLVIDVGLPTREVEGT